MISCQTKFNPADSEWEAWLGAIDDLHRRAGSLRRLVVADGGHGQLDGLRAVKRTDPQPPSFRRYAPSDSSARR